MRATIVLCVSILALMASFSAANATQIIAMSPQKMGQTASEVVRGSVTSVQSYWNASHTKIFTETVVAVDETYKGSATGQVTLLQLGGEVDGVRVTVHGALSWTAGEEVLLFLEPYTEGRFHVSGFSQGKFAVERDPVTGRAFVRAPRRTARCRWIASWPTRWGRSIGRVIARGSGRGIFRRIRRR
jgi:hypothetical protein